MNRVKKIVLFCTLYFGLLYTVSGFANQNESDWQVKNLENVQISLSTRNNSGETVSLICVLSEKYLIGIHVNYKLQGNANYAFDYRLDNNGLVFKGRNFAFTWMVRGVKYNVGKDGIQGEIDKYKTLFQQMLHAKKSLVVNAIDADGKIQGTAKFSVKGLPEALIEFAKQCGSDFQTYSGINIDQMEK